MFMTLQQLGRSTEVVVILHQTTNQNTLCSVRVSVQKMRLGMNVQAEPAPPPHSSAYDGVSLPHAAGA